MNKIIGIICILAAFIFAGCGKKGDPVAPPVLPAQATMITGKVVDSSGSPIDSVAIKVKYYFAPVMVKSVKSSPCSLTYFTAIRITDGARLSWQTIWEMTTNSWRIERSVLADSGFIAIAQLPAYGTTNSVVNYSYNDTTANAFQTYYYRLCLIDVTGSRYYYGPVGLGPMPIYHDGFTSGYPCPFSINTQFGFSLACSSQVTFVIKQKGQIVKTLVEQNFVTGLYSIMWNGKDDNNASSASGYYNSVCTMSRHDSAFQFKEPLFINIEDISSSRVNDYSDAQGAFIINDIPIDSTFTCKDETGDILNTSRVCDSVTVYAIKGGFPERAITLTLGRNATSTINFVLE